jgi:hypothetical protein
MNPRYFLGAVAVTCALIAVPLASGAQPSQESFTLSAGETLTVRCPTPHETWNARGFPLVDRCPSGPTTTVAPTTSQATTTTMAPTTTTAPSGGLVTPASYFGTDVTNQLVSSWPVSANSQTAVSALLGTGTITTWLNEDRTILMVPSTQPEVLVAEGNATNGENWCGLYFSDQFTGGTQGDAPPTGSWDSLFYAPIPLGVYYSNASTDHEVAILKTGADPQEYDFWLFGEGGTSTGSGNQTYPGQIEDPFWSAGSPNPDVDLYDVGNGGQLSTEVNPPDFPNGCGDSASGLSVAATTITNQDVYDGAIDHAMSLEIPYQLCTGDTYPATNPYPDCTGPGKALQEGDYFRLSSSAVCPTSPALTVMVCVALKNYGMIVMDRNTANVGAVYLEGENPADWAFDGQSGTAPIQAAMGSDNQGNVLNGIPWSDLQAVQPPL